jgi:hypothetical protein
MPRWKRFDDVCVRDIRHLVMETPAEVSPDLGMDEVLEAVVRNPRTRNAYVIGSNAPLLGQFA